MPSCQNFNIFPLGLQKPGSFWEFKKKGQHWWIQIPNRCRSQRTVQTPVHFYARPFNLGKKKKNLVKQLSSVMSLTATFDSLYLSLSRRAMCRESGFFPTETKFLPSDPHRHPTSLLLPFPSFCLSAVKGNNQTPTSIIHHTQQQRPKNRVKSSFDLCLWSYCRQHIKPSISVLYAGKYYRTITVQPLLI